MIEELREERSQIDEAIASLERLARARGPRRGRPPAWLAPITEHNKRGRPMGRKNKPKNEPAV